MSTAAIRRALRAWYRREARDLPWRRTRDPYCIWLSEIMLQQTRVEAALPYYERFVGRFPTVERLAAAKLDDVLALWAGLGYYSRARNMHAAARAVVDDWGGEFPRAAADLQKLPGVGRYTAGAVASIALGERVPVVDGNVKRVLARLGGIETSIDEAETVERMWAWAEELVPPGEPGEFNQALMELGARVCVPKRPRCEACPLTRLCVAREKGLTERLPVRREKKAAPQVRAVAAVIEKDGRVLMVQRPPRGLLGGMWELPGAEIDPGAKPAAVVSAAVKQCAGLEVKAGALLGEVEHVFTHRRLRVFIYRCAYVGGRVRRRRHVAARWVRLKGGDGLRGMALASLDRKVLEIGLGRGFGV